MKIVTLVLAVSITGEAIADDVPATVLSAQSQLPFSNATLKTYAVIPSGLQICVPAGTGHTQTILLTQAVTPGGSEAVLTDGSGDTRQIIMHSDLLENVDKYALRMPSGEQVVISTSAEGLHSLESSVPSTGSFLHSIINGGWVA